MVQQLVYWNRQYAFMLDERRTLTVLTHLKGQLHSEVVNVFNNLTVEEIKGIGNQVYALASDGIWDMSIPLRPRMVYRCKFAFNHHIASFGAVIFKTITPRVERRIRLTGFRGYVDEITDAEIVHYSITTDGTRNVRVQIITGAEDVTSGDCNSPYLKARGNQIIGSNDQILATKPNHSRLIGCIEGHYVILIEVPHHNDIYIMNATTFILQFIGRTTRQAMMRYGFIYYIDDQQQLIRYGNDQYSIICKDVKYISQMGDQINIVTSNERHIYPEEAPSSLQPHGRLFIGFNDIIVMTHT